MNLDLINIRNYEDTDYMYIGRPSKYGNPYSFKTSNLATKVESKEESLRLFREYINENPNLIDNLIKDIKEGGYTKLGCWCSPGKCHGDILIEKIKERRYKSIL